MEIAVCAVGEQRKGLVFEITRQPRRSSSIHENIGREIIDDIHVRIPETPLDGREGVLCRGD